MEGPLTEADSNRAKTFEDWIKLAAQAAIRQEVLGLWSQINLLQAKLAEANSKINHATKAGFVWPKE